MTDTTGREKALEDVPHAEDAWLEHIRSNNYDHEYENIHSAFIAGFNAALCRASTLWMIQHHYTEAGAEEDTER